MNTALLVLRVVPGILLIGHGLQKLVPANYSPPLLHARGHRATATGSEQLGIRPGLPAAAHARNGIWNAEGGFEFPLLLPMSNVARAGIVLAIGVGAGLLTVIASWVAQRSPARPGIPAAG